MTRDAVIREMEPGKARPIYQGGATAAHCPDCDARVAAYVEDYVTLHLGPVPDGSDYTENEREGYQVLLAESFTNRGSRHPTGHPWYHRGKHRRKEPLRIRVPAIVTCCRSDFVLPSLVGPVDRAYATADPVEKMHAWEEIERERNQAIYDSGVWDDGDVEESDNEDVTGS